MPSARRALPHASLPLIKRGGSMCIYGVLTDTVLHLEKSRAEFDFNLFVHRGRRAATQEEAQAARTSVSGFVKASSAPPTSSRTRLPSATFEQGFDAVHERKVIKALLTY